MPLFYWPTDLQFMNPLDSESMDALFGRPEHRLNSAENYVMENDLEEVHSLIRKKLKIS